MKEIRTRFAPSPTGYLHIGGVRTALFCVLFARHHNGKVYLRIDDTDRERLVPGAIRSLIDDLKWVGIRFDEGPTDEEIEMLESGSVRKIETGYAVGSYIQSLRKERYIEVAEELIRRGFAYRCDCKPEDLAKEREEQMARKDPSVGYSGRCRDRNVPKDAPHVVRFKINEDDAVEFTDAIKGFIRWEKNTLRDPVLLKSDGFPTYHLASIVDDHDMGISHILRADEWLSSTPLHLKTFEAMDWEKPVFAHLPPVLGSNGKKLSKRHGSTFLRAFREEGYIPEAIINYLALVGWSAGGGEEGEIFTFDELAGMFDLDHVNKTGGIFDYTKLKWMNGVYIRRMQPEELRPLLLPFLTSAGLDVDEDKLMKIIPHIQERLELLPDAAPLVDWLFTDAIERDMAAALKKDMDKEKAVVILTKVSEKLSALQSFDVASIEAVLHGELEGAGVKTGSFFMLIRIAVTGKKVTPPLMESMYALGKEQTLRRLSETIDLLKAT